MRVLTFVHSFELGGVERIALRLVEYWRSLGIDAPLFVGRIEGDMRAEFAAALAFETPRQPPIPTRAWETLWMILTLPRALRRTRPDVLFCAGNSYTVVAVAMKLLLGRDCPPILAKISNSLDRREMPGWWRWAYRQWLRVQGRFIDHFVGMENPMAGEIAEGLGVAADRVTIIPDPALSETMIASMRAQQSNARASHNGRRFVAIGRLTAQKNFALMLRAFQRGARAGDSLTIIGDGPERRKLAGIASDLELGERVEFRGYLSEPAAILRQFDTCLLSSNYEGVPAVVIEAIAAGLPVVATDCSRSMDDLLLHGKLGRLVAVGDEDALAAAIGDPVPLPRPSDEERSLAQARRFTVERASEAYLQAMRRLVVPGSQPVTGAPLPHHLSNEKICA